MEEKLTNNKHATIEAKHAIAQAVLGSDNSLRANIKNRLGLVKRFTIILSTL